MLVYDLPRALWETAERPEMAEYSLLFLYSALHLWPTAVSFEALMYRNYYAPITLIRLVLSAQTQGSGCTVPALPAASHLQAWIFNC